MKHSFQKNVQPTSSPHRSGDSSAGEKTIEAKKKYERQIEELNRKVNQFRVDAQRFFAGDLKLPPEELREQIRSELRSLQNSKYATSVDRFRLNSMEAQFNSQVELFGRRLREREEGGARRAAERPELHHNPREGVVFSREGAVESLYKGLYVEGRSTKAAMDLERFRGHLQKQAEVIRAKTGAVDIQFRIAVEDGKKKIKAKPIKKKAGA